MCPNSIKQSEGCAARLRQAIHSIHLNIIIVLFIFFYSLHKFMRVIASSGAVFPTVDYHWKSRLFKYVKYGSNAWCAANLTKWSYYYDVWVGWLRPRHLSTEYGIFAISDWLQVYFWDSLTSFQRMTKSEEYTERGRITFSFLSLIDCTVQKYFEDDCLPGKV